ncbi:MAG: hypothetical protein Q4G11_01445, partial [Gallicola sp.]|nr:hypothetical protein [Gallicola sp.]
MNKNFKNFNIRMLVALVLAVSMIVQPIASLAMTLEEESSPVKVVEETGPIETTKEASIDLESLEPKKDRENLGWMNLDKTGESFDIYEEMEILLYNNKDELDLKTLILQDTIALDIEEAEKAGLKITEVENTYSSETYKEYELETITDKKVSAFPIRMEMTEIKEGPAALVLGENKEGQWLTAEVLNKENRFELVDPIEGKLLEEGKTLEQSNTEEKIQAEKKIQEAERKALEEKEEQEAKEKAAAEQKIKEAEEKV